VPRLPILDRRGEASARLDQEQEKQERPVSFIPWRQFDRDVQFDQGDHITLVGRTKSGKTTLAVGGLLPHFTWSVVMATKVKDDKLYAPLEAQGFVMSANPALDAKRHPKIIFKPPLKGATKADKEQQAEMFRQVLGVAFAEGGWAIYMDEVRYLSDNMGLKTELETLWLQGRSLGITMIAATQNPVSIPRVAFDQVEHLFFWRQTERERVKQMADMAGSEAATVKSVVPRLPQHEALYVHPADDRMYRTKYQV
jgi:hypothetical protein